MPDVTHADRLVHEAQVALDAINEDITNLRAEKIRVGHKIATLIQERKPLMRIVTAAQGRRTKGNGDGPDQPQ